MIYDVFYSLLVLIEKLTFFNKQLSGFIISLSIITIFLIWVKYKIFVENDITGKDRALFLFQDSGLYQISSIHFDYIRFWPDVITKLNYPFRVKVFHGRNAYIYFDLV